jgi:hypothetical protein
MHVLIDEDTPVQILEPLRHVLRGHQINGIHDIGWSGKKDPQVLRDIRGSTPRYEVLLTHDKSQLTNPGLCDLIKKAGVHHVRYDQGSGTLGLALAMAAIIAAMPKEMDDLESAKGQRLVKIKSLDRTAPRHDIVDPARQPPSPYWPR